MPDLRLPNQNRPLNPYGHSAPDGHTVLPPEYLAAAFERARFKMANVVQEAPVGADQIYLVYALINLGIGVAWLGTTVVLLAASGAIVGASIWPIVLIASSSFWFKWHRNTRPDQPQRAVQAWVGAITRKKWERLDRLRVPADRDNFPRKLPGEPLEMPLAGIDDLKQYWPALRRRVGLNGARWGLRKPNVRPLGPHAALVEMEVSAPRVPQWAALLVVLGIALAIAGLIFGMIYFKQAKAWLGVFPLLLLVLFVGLLVVVGWRRKHQIKKVVVWNGSEWRLLSGEWQAPEERDLRWMQ
jgi:hypothetical protein